jgi:hypothetical protein
VLPLTRIKDKLCISAILSFISSLIFYLFLCYPAFTMTLTKTVAVPPDRRVLLDLTLPETFTPGSVLRLEINPSVVEPKTRESMLAAVERLCGLYAGTEPPGAYLERHHAENLLEREIEERREKERECLNR